MSLRPDFSWPTLYIINSTVIKDSERTCSLWAARRLIGGHTRCKGLDQLISDYIIIIICISLQCFDAVGWAAGTASGL